jgi:hypothetical protein
MTRPVDVMRVTALGSTQAQKRRFRHYLSFAYFTFAAMRISLH